MEKLVSFFEIPATDFGRAVKFYETILGIELPTFECDTEKMAFFPEEDGHPAGSISYAEDFLPSSNGVLVSLRVENMETTLAKITANGGKVTRHKTKIEADALGYFSLFLDSEGNRVGLYSDK